MISQRINDEKEKIWFVLEPVSSTGSTGWQHRENEYNRPRCLVVKGPVNDGCPRYKRTHEYCSPLKWGCLFTKRQAMSFREETGTPSRGQLYDRDLVVFFNFVPPLISPSLALSNVEGNSPLGLALLALTWGNYLKHCQHGMRR